MPQAMITGSIGLGRVGVISSSPGRFSSDTISEYSAWRSWAGRPRRWFCRRVHRLTLPCISSAPNHVPAKADRWPDAEAYTRIASFR